MQFILGRYHQAGRAFTHGISYAATYSSAKHTNNQQSGSQFGHGMIIDILEYGIKALLTSYNELENGAVILIWHS